MTRMINVTPLNVNKITSLRLASLLANPKAKRLQALAFRPLTLCYANYGLDTDANSPKV